jgi:hypothetical protein
LTRLFFQEIFIMGTICLKTNQHRLIANLRHAFNQASMLGELLQNARRAGASRIDIAADEHSITVTDDGSGIADLQSLIFIAESGWDEALQKRENAFGMGVLSTLYFAERLSVHSGEQAFEASTAAILRGDDIEVHAAESRIGTRIHLTGVSSSLGHLSLPEWVKQQLQRLCEAFPVRVRYNGIELERPLADPALPWRETAMGRVLIDLHAPLKWRSFLQGLPIGHVPMGLQYQIILLRDDLPARLPDRQHLLDEEADHPRIQAAVGEAYRQALIEAKKTWPEHEFVTLYAGACLSSSNADLLNDIRLVPRSWFRDWANDPPGHHLFRKGHAPDGVIREAALNEAGVWRIDEEEDEEFTAETWLCAQNAFLLEKHDLDAGHWLLPMAKPVSSEQVHVRHGVLIHDADHPVLADDEVQLLLVDDLNVRLGREPETYAVDVARKGNTIYLTPQASCLDIMPLVSDYCFEDGYDESIEYEDRRTISRFIAIGCTQDPGLIVKTLLPDSLRYAPQPKLAGKAVRLVFNDDGRLRTVTED